MLKIHTNDGRTIRLDLNDERQAQEWLRRLKRKDFQQTITGVSVLQRCGGHFRCPTCKRTSRLTCSTCGHPASKIPCGTGVQYSISKPAGFDNDAFYLIENVEPDEKTRARGGERVSCFVGDSRLSLMVHKCQSAARISLTKTGKQRFSPAAE